MKYTVKTHSNESFLQDNMVHVPRKVYEAYRVAMDKPNFMPEFDNQDFDVKMAWIFACLNDAQAKRTGTSLYEGYFTAVDGVALKNNQIKLSRFEDMDQQRRDAWSRAADVLNKNI